MSNGNSLQCLGVYRTSLSNNSEEVNIPGNIHFIFSLWCLVEVLFPIFRITSSYISICINLKIFQKYIAHINIHNYIHTCMHEYRQTYMLRGSEIPYHLFKGSLMLSLHIFHIPPWSLLQQHNATLVPSFHLNLFYQCVLPPDLWKLLSMASWECSDFCEHCSRNTNIWVPESNI